MMKKITYLMFTMVALFIGNQIKAQCAAGEVEITIEATTDTYGYESFWDLTPTGNGCGNGALATYGNTVVGCAGGGAQVAAAGEPGDMGNNVTVTEVICLTEGAQYDINSIDDWGDGGTTFNILSGGVSIGMFSFVDGTNDVYTFTASQPLSDDLIVEAIGFTSSYDTETSYLTPTQQPYSVFACGASNDGVVVTVLNNGIVDATNFDINYEMFDATTGTSLGVVTETIAGPLVSGASQDYTFSTAADLTSDELFTIDTWTTLGADLDNTNDSIIGAIVFNVAPVTVDIANPFYTGFEQFGTELQNLDNAWGWSAENGNADGSFYGAFYDPSLTVAQAGEMAMYLPGDNSTAGAGGDDWLFSPCLTLDAANTYSIRFQTRAGGDGAGGFIAENLGINLASGNTSGDVVENVGNITLDVTDGEWQEVMIDFSPAVSGDYNIAIHKNTTGVSWWSPIDEFYVEQLVDNDNDGFFSSEDCDDTNAAVNPGATEVCDGIDNNCDGMIDEGLLNTYYADTDGDSFGDAANSIMDCATTAPAGYTTDNTDCDDTNANINTFATEVCDGIDNNCDGMIDEGFVPTTYYADADADGFGDVNVTMTNCNGVAPAGFVADATDFDDTNAAAYPNAPELCDLVDNNNDGQVDEGCPVSINEIAFAQAMNVYPNPATETLNVSFELANTVDAEVSIFTIAGQVIEVKTFENASNVNATFNVSSLNTGVYMVRVKTEEGISTQRFVVSK